MKILVLGATGMAGHTIILYLIEQGHEVIAYSKSKFLYCENIIGDAFDTNHFKETLVSQNFDAVINCIGLLNQFANDNPSKAVYLNSYIPHLIVETLKNRNTKLLHMSTDCVFAGNTGPYHENSFQDGKTFYDRSKALGEVNDNKNLTFRNSIIGPDINVNGIGLFNWFMSQNSEIQGYSRVLWTGVTTLTLAKAMEQALIEDLCGLYNLVYHESISKYDLLMLFNKYFKKDSLTIHNFTDKVLDKSLVNNRSDFSFRVPSYENMIKEMREWIVSHRDLYPHYVFDQEH